MPKSSKFFTRSKISLLVEFLQNDTQLFIHPAYLCAMFRPALCLVALIFALSACKTDISGELLPNLPPETSAVVDTIIRSGPDRLESRVTIQWWGNDPDGFVAGYEYTFDDPVTPATVWLFTRSQDSIFLLQTPAGQDTANFRFSIRAIDNQGLADPTPAALVYPVRNSPPSAQVVPGLSDPVLSFPILRFFWSGSDPDGTDNLSRFELYWNDTTNAPFVVDQSVTAATFEALEPGVTGEATCRLYLNNNTNAEAGTMSGMRIGSWNKLYVRAIDQSEAVSGFAASDSVFIRPVRSNVLLVNAYSGGSGPIFDFYHNQMLNLGLGLYDSLTLFESGATPQIAADNLTQERVFALFDLIVWFGNNAQSSLSLAQRTSGDFFAQGGKMLMAVYVSSSFDQQSAFLDFTPIAALVDPQDTTLLLNTGAAITPIASGWPNLQGTSIVGVVRPIITQIGATPVYEAALTARDNATLGLSPWNGASVIMASKRDALGNTNFLLSTLELQRMDGLGTINEFFEKVIQDEFGF
jgi:hypothetical protein